MNHRALSTTAAAILTTLGTTPPESFSQLDGDINREMNSEGVPFEDRRFVAMAIHDLAEGKARAMGGDSAKVLRKIGEKALDLHARWAGVKWYQRRAPVEAETRAELQLMQREQRELDGKVLLIDRAVEGVENVVAKGIWTVEACGGFLPHTIDARTSVALTGVTGEQAEAKKPRSKRVGPDAPGEPAATTE
jgi:hypothetical protein